MQILPRKVVNDDGMKANMNETEKAGAHFNA